MPSPPARSRTSRSTTSAAAPRSTSSVGSTESIGRSSTVIAPGRTSPRASFARHTPRAARNENGPRSTEKTRAAPAAAAHSGNTPGPPPERHNATTSRLFFSDSAESPRFAFFAFATSLFAARAYARVRSSSSSAASESFGAASSARFLKCASTPARLGSRSNSARFRTERRAFCANVGRHSWSSTSHSGPDMVWRHRMSVASRSSALRAARSLDANARRFESSCATIRPRASSLSACATARSSRTPSRVAASCARKRRVFFPASSASATARFVSSFVDVSSEDADTSRGTSSCFFSSSPTPVMSLAHVSSDNAAACHSPAAANAFPSR